ncbi:MAG: hypothetical protein KJ646_00225 [Nanoarchaeota archaeon]|nr:hypothetical protein [Nanoarchaeota archaeon]MBU4116552.1 hypothetical protein [Nanoarchaeota archaeon]
MGKDKPLEYYALRERKEPFINPESPEAEAFYNVLKHAILRSPKKQDYQTKTNQ